MQRRHRRARRHVPLRADRAHPGRHLDRGHELRHRARPLQRRAGRHAGLHPFGRHQRHHRWRAGDGRGLQLGAGLQRRHLGPGRRLPRRRDRLRRRRRGPRRGLRLHAAAAHACARLHRGLRHRHGDRPGRRHLRGRRADPTAGSGHGRLERRQRRRLHLQRRLAHHPDGHQLPERRDAAGLRPGVRAAAQRRRGQLGDQEEQDRRRGRLHGDGRRLRRRRPGQRQLPRWPLRDRRDRRRRRRADHRQLARHLHRRGRARDDRQRQRLRQAPAPGRATLRADAGRRRGRGPRLPGGGQHPGLGRRLRLARRQPRRADRCGDRRRGGHPRRRPARRHGQPDPLRPDLGGLARGRRPHRHRHRGDRRGARIPRVPDPTLRPRRERPVVREQQQRRDAHPRRLQHRHHAGGADRDQLRLSPGAVGRSLQRRGRRLPRLHPPAARRLPRQRRGLPDRGQLGARHQRPAGGGAPGWRLLDRQRDLQQRRGRGQALLPRRQRLLHDHAHHLQSEHQRHPPLPQRPVRGRVRDGARATRPDRLDLRPQLLHRSAGRLHDRLPERRRRHRPRHHHRVHAARRLHLPELHRRRRLGRRQGHLDPGLARAGRGRAAGRAGALRGLRQLRQPGDARLPPRQHAALDPLLRHHHELHEHAGPDVHLARGQRHQHPQHQRRPDHRLQRGRAQRSHLPRQQLHQRDERRPARQRLHALRGGRRLPRCADPLRADQPCQRHDQHRGHELGHGARPLRRPGGPERLGHRHQHQREHRGLPGPGHGQRQAHQRRRRRHQRHDRGLRGGGAGLQRAEHRQLRRRRLPLRPQRRHHSEDQHRGLELRHDPEPARRRDPGSLQPDQRLDREHQRKRHPLALRRDAAAQRLRPALRRRHLRNGRRRRHRRELLRLGRRRVPLGRLPQHDELARRGGEVLRHHRRHLRDQHDRQLLRHRPGSL